MPNLLTFVAVVAVVAASLTLLLSARHHRRMKRLLTEPLRVEKSFQEGTVKESRSTVSLEEAAAASVSTFDVLYNTLKLDSHALRGMDHLHHAQQFDSLGDLMSFMKDSIINSEPGSRDWRQMVHKYKGYTGEEQAFDHLRGAGHHVEVPESGVNPGVDATVDGIPLNVKVTDHPHYIRDALNADPNTHIYTNSEMGAAFGDNPDVTIDPALSAQDAFHATSDTLESMGKMGDLLNEIPLLTLAIAATRNAYGLIKGKKDIRTALEHTALDTAGTGAGGWAGAQAGMMIGLALAPVTGGISAVAIPALATGLGTILGSKTGRGVTQWIKERHVRTSRTSMIELAKGLKTTFEARFDDFCRTKKLTYQNGISECTTLAAQAQNWLGRLLFPRFMIVFYTMAAKELYKECGATLEYCKVLHGKIATSTSEDEAGLMLYAQGAMFFKCDRLLTQAFDRLDEAYKSFTAERSKVA